MANINLDGVWQAPKTNWSGRDDEFFNLTPDYQRIKGNIEYLHSLLEFLGKLTFDINPMPIYTEKDVPTPDFFNVIVGNINVLYQYSFVMSVYPDPMKLYDYNEDTPTYRDLNTIERNLLRLYEANIGELPTE